MSTPIELKAVRLAGRAVGKVQQGADVVARARATTRFPYRAPSIPRGVDVVAKERKTGVAFDTAWARKDAGRMARALIVEGPLRLLVKGVARPEIVGLDRLNDLIEGEYQPVVFAANHHSHLDAPLMITSIPAPWRHRLVVGAAADYFFSTRLTGALSALTLNAIPIERTKVNRRSADLATSLLAEGWSLVIFPEGGRSPDGWGQPFRGGAAFLSVRTGAPVVPVHLEGTGAVFGKGMKRPKPGPTRVTFGAPMWPDPDDDARSFGARIERAVAVLGDEATSDWWTARRHAASATTPALTGPAATTWRRAWALADRRGRGRAAERRRQKRTWPKI